MAKKPTITTVSAGFASNTQLNDNFAALRDAFDNTLSRDGSTPNAMGADLDMNNNDILNAGEVDVQGLTISGVQVFPANTQIATTYATQNYTGNGSTTVYSMGFNPGIKANVDVYIDGVYQNQDAFSISGTNLTFTAAPPLNSAIEIKVPVNVTSLVNTDSSQVVYNQGGTGAQDRSVQSRLRDFVSVKDFGAVGDGVTDDTAAIQNAVDAAEAVYFPDGETFRLTAEVVVPANRRLFGGGEIFVDQSPYVRAIRMGSNGFVDGLKFKGNGVATARDAGLSGGQMGLAIASFGTSNVKVSNCQFFDFVSDTINTGGALVQFSNGNAFEVSGCYFDDSNDGFDDINAAYTTGDTIITKNISYSNCDLFFHCASVGLGTKVGTSDVDVTANHIVTDNIAIKNRWEPAAAGRTLGRHGILAHYDGGVSHLTAANNIIGNVSRHGVYLRGNSTVPAQLCGPNTIVNNRLLYCGSGDASLYSSGIRVESTLPTIITGNYIENSGYFPDGTAGSSPAYDIECVRGVQDAIIADNTLIGAKDGSILLSMTVANREVTNVKISENTIKTSTFGIGFIQSTSTSTLYDVKILFNHIDLTGADYSGSTAAGIAFEATSGAPIEKYSLQIMGNTVVGLGKTSNQYGLTALFGTNDLQTTALVADNIFRDLEFGIASVRFFSAGTLSYLPHRILGTSLKWVRNRFVSCEEALVLPKNASTILAVVEDDNIYEDCTTPGIATTVTWLTAVEGKSIGKDSSGNLLVEFKASAIPTAQQYYRGDRIINTAPAAGGNMGWVCVSSGTPGTWKSFGTIAV